MSIKRRLVVGAFNRVTGDDANDRLAKLACRKDGSLHGPGAADVYGSNSNSNRNLMLRIIFIIYFMTSRFAFQAISVFTGSKH